MKSRMLGRLSLVAVVDTVRARTVQRIKHDFIDDASSGYLDSTMIQTKAVVLISRTRIIRAAYTTAKVDVAYFTITRLAAFSSI